MDFRISELSTEEGVYKLNAGGSYTRGTETRNILDFITWDDIKIIKVIRNSDNQVFSIDESLDINDDEYENIELIYIEKAICRLQTEEGTDIPLSEAVKYIEEDNTTFDDIKDTIESKFTEGIRLEATLLKSVKKLTLQQFLIKFFTTWNNERNTIFVDSREVQTEMGKRRSLGDIYMICNYYYPEITLKELIQLLYIDLTNHISGFRSSICSQINKRVWYVDTDDSNGMFDKISNDEFGKKHAYYINNLD